MKTAEIKLTVTLDDNNVPEHILWESTDSNNKEALPVKSPIANKKNRMVSVKNISCKTLLARSVPINIKKVNTPHKSRYQATAVSLDL